MNSDSARRRRPTLAAVAIALALGYARAATAQNTGAAAQPDLTRLSLEELLGVEFDKVYGASRFVQDISRAPASVTIVSAEDIARHGYRTVGQAVESAASFYATNDRNYSEIGIRGFSRPGDYNTRVLVLIDGHRLNDNIYDAAYLGSEFPVDIDLVERIEIIRGPRSSVYGSNAFLAVINVLTRTGRNVGAGELAASGGSLEAGRVRASIGRRTPGVEWLISGSGFRSSGYESLYFPEFDSPATNNGVAVDRDHENAENAFGKVSMGGFSIEGVWSRRLKAIPTASFDTVFNDPRTQTIDGRSFVDVEYGRTLSNTTELLVRGFLDHVDYQGHYPAPRYVDPSVISLQDDEGHGESAGSDLMMTRRFQGRHVVTAGADFVGDLRQVQSVSESAAPGQLSVDEHHHTARWSVYGQDEVALGTHAIVNLGVRHDQHTTSGGSTNPRLALILMPSQDATLKLLYGTAYRAPSAYELYYDTGGFMSDLKPETIRTTEVVHEQRFGRSVSTSAVYFEYRIEDLINQIDQPDAIYGFGFANLSRALARGFEVTADAHWGRYRVRLAQTIERVTDRDTDEELSNAPRYLTRLGGVVPLAHDRVFLGVDGDYLNQRRTIGGAWVPGRYLQHLSLNAPRAVGKLDIGVTIRNVFDTRYYDPAGAEHVQTSIIQDGRTFEAHGTYRF